MALRIRVLGVHRDRRDGPVPAWAYYAKAYDERDAHKHPVWACGHEHDNPLRAQSCGLDWLRADVQDLRQVRPRPGPLFRAKRRGLARLAACVS
jgi:hypothetical protein